MSKTVTWFLIGSLILMAGIGWYQYRLYRTPLTSPLSESQHLVTSAQADAIRAIVQPRFESVGSADLYLNDASYGVVMQIGSQTRFYPFQILMWHEVVLDVVNGVPVLVSFDPLTYTTGVYQRDPEEMFQVSGKKWNNNSLLTDLATNSLWSQMTGVAIDGERRDQSLQKLPSQLMSWKAFFQTHPQGSVLTTNTGFDRDYSQNPYEGYHESLDIWFVLDNEDDRLPAKSLVYGVERNGIAVAFPVDKPEDFDTIQSIVGKDVSLQPAYWFAWIAMHPKSEIYSPNQ